MITKSRFVGLLAVLVVGFLVLRPGEEPSDSEDRGGESESATDRQLQPREPAFLEPTRDYGIASRPGAGSAPAPYGRPESSRGAPYPQDYSGGYGVPDPYDAHAQAATGGYRFRPLSEQEQRRTPAPYPDRYQYATPYDPPPSRYPSSRAQPRPSAQARYSAPPAYPDLQQETYSFRPLEKSPGARGRWQGPYQEPDHRFDGYPADPWTAPPNPQWGSMPPAQPMYPNLYRGSSRQITAR